MTIYEIKRLTRDTEPYFFSKDTMKFFGQTLKDFKVKKQTDGRYRISAQSSNHETVRFFNPKNNQLEQN